MQKTFRNTTILMVLIFLGTQWGFYSTYTSQFPTFENATPTIHVHGALLMTWLVLLVLQPALLYMGRPKLHRSIGKVSWVLGPAIIISLYLIGRHGYWRAMEFDVPMHDALTLIALDSRGLICFTIFWTMAMVYRKKSQYHMRYMIATGLLAIGPGIGRGILFSFDASLGMAMTISDLLVLLIAGILLFIDITGKKSNRASLTIFLIFIIYMSLWQIRDTVLWQSFAQHYANIFY
ncbi:hypothetical protein ACPUEN_08190 [Algoriphagus yeomjeoni]|uniref:hypothetical protein n=1 Tax=Algoriphagus yeomjeoni TaxID=291403 RepID=UPI003CE4BF55